MSRSSSHLRVLFPAGLLISLILPLLVLMQPALLAYFDARIYDGYLAQKRRNAASAQIVIVDIDEESLQEYGQWPWPRYRIASLLDRLQEGGAAVVALDVLFPEPDRTSLAVIAEDLWRDRGIRLDYPGDGAILDNDLVLRHAVEQGKIVLGYQFRYNEGGRFDSCHLHPLALMPAEPAADPEGFIFKPDGVTCTLPLLAEKSANSGYLNIGPDIDGILRRAPLIIAYEGSFYPSLALAAVMEAAGIKRIGLTRHPGGYLLILGQQEVPLDGAGNLLINFRARAASFAYLSASDLLAGRIPAESIAGKLVFVGTSAAGLQELRATPLDPLFPGVEIHATIADNLLTGDVLARPQASAALEFMAAFLCGGFFLISSRNGGAMRSVVAMTAGSFFILYATFQLFAQQDVYFSPVLLLLVLAANFVLLNLLKIWLSERQAKKQLREIVLAQEGIIKGMASLTETRHPELGGHIMRAQEYVRLLATLARELPAYRSFMTDEVIDYLYKTAPLHDIGKVGIPDRILLKKGKLTVEEFEEVKKHPEIGVGIIAAIEQRIGAQPFLQFAREIISTHHEKWDGSGYPNGLRGEGIPLAGRIMAIADTYDALTSQRAYKETYSHGQALQIMQDQAGASFDHELFQLFLAHSDEFLRLAQQDS